MIKCLITQPNYDKVTSYLFYFGKEILKENYPIKVQFMNLEGNKVSKNNVESYLKKQNPKVVLFNGHGNDWTICGYQNEDLIIMNENEDLLKEKLFILYHAALLQNLAKMLLKKEQRHL